MLRSSGGRAIPKDRANLLRRSGAVLFGGVVGPVLLLSGLELSRAASVSMLLSLENVATAILAHLFFRKHIGRWAWLAVFGIELAGSLLGAEG